MGLAEVREKLEEIRSSADAWAFNDTAMLRIKRLASEALALLDSEPSEQCGCKPFSSNPLQSEEPKDGE